MVRSVDPCAQAPPPQTERVSTTRKRLGVPPTPPAGALHRMITPSVLTPGASHPADPHRKTPGGAAPAPRCLGSECPRLSLPAHSRRGPARGTSRAPSAPPGPSPVGTVTPACRLLAELCALQSGPYKTALASASPNRIHSSRLCSRPVSSKKSSCFATSVCNFFASLLTP